MPGIPTTLPYSMPTADELPGNTATWSLDPERMVLLIHDMQRYFLAPLDPERPRATLVRNAVLLREHFAAAGAPVAYTAQPGGMSDTERGLLKDFWGPGMRVDAGDRDVVDELAPGPRDWRLTKWRYSAFIRSNLLSRLRAAGRDQLVVCGVYAHVGVLATVLDAFSNDVQPFLVADAVADFSADYHRRALEYAAERCAVVTTTKEVIG